MSDLPFEQSSSDHQEKSFDTTSLDLSIVRINIDAHLGRDKKRFYRLALLDENLALAPRKAPTSVHIEKPICLDFGIFAEKIAKLHVHEIAESDKPSYNFPVELDDQLAECTPQFILRNIPKIEHYYDLERPLPFNEEFLPIADALEEIQKAREAHIEEVQFCDLKSSQIINDFRIFLEEIFFLCPWDNITSRAPSEDSPWHPKYSNAKLAQYLLDAQNTLFIVSDRGMTEISTKPFVPVDKKPGDKNKALSLMPSF